MLSFIISVFWICLYSYILVWMVTIIGFTFNIADTVMSLTFVAAAVSVQDALSGTKSVLSDHFSMSFFFHIMVNKKCVNLRINDKEGWRL